MAQQVLKYKDETLTELMKLYPMTTPISWYMMANYAYYVERKPVLSDPMFDRLVAAVLAGWQDSNSPYKRYMKLEDIKAGSSFTDWTAIPQLQKSAACGLIKDVYGNNVETVYKGKTVLPYRPSERIVKEQPKALPAPPLCEVISKQKEEEKKQQNKEVLDKISKVRMEALLYVNPQTLITEEQKIKVRDIAASFAFKYGGAMFVSGDGTSRADMCKRTMQLIDALNDAGFNVTRYMISDVIIDSRKADVWNML